MKRDLGNKLIEFKKSNKTFTKIGNIFHQKNKISFQLLLLQKYKNKFLYTSPQIKLGKKL